MLVRGVRTHPEPSEGKNNKVLRVCLKDLIVSPEWWCRTSLNSDMVKRYENIYRFDRRKIPMIDIALIGDALILFDGFHRYEAMKLAGITEIEANVHYGLSYRGLAYEASKRNLTHGLPLNNKDLRYKVFRSYIKSGNNMIGNYKYKSYREIAADFGGVKNHTTIYRWIERDFPKLHKKMKAEGIEHKEFPEDFDRDIEQLTLQQALSHLEQIGACSIALKSNDARLELKDAIKDTLKELKVGRKVSLEDPADDEETPF